MPQEAIQGWARAYFPRLVAMRLRVRFTVRCLMVVVAVAAVALLIVKLTRSPAVPRYRVIEVSHRRPDGSVAAVETIGLSRDARADACHGMPDGETRFREVVARLKASKAEYKVTKPR